METKIEVTRSSLIAALAKWEAEAAAKDWAPRTDDERHADSADNLIRLLMNGE